MLPRVTDARKDFTKCGGEHFCSRMRSWHLQLRGRCSSVRTMPGGRAHGSKRATRQEDCIVCGDTEGLVPNRQQTECIRATFEVQDTPPPTNVLLTITSNESRLDLNWQAPVVLKGNVTSYRIQTSGDLTFKISSQHEWNSFQRVPLRHQLSPETYSRSLSCLCACKSLTMRPVWSVRGPVQQQSGLLRATAQGRQYLSTTSRNPAEWKCLACPRGAHCDRRRPIATLSPRWDTGASTGLRAQHLRGVSACGRLRGAGAPDAHDGFSEGVMRTEDTLCTVCSDGFNREAGMCRACTNEALAIRLGIFAGVLGVLGLLIYIFRRRLRRWLRKYGELWSDVLHIITIEIAFLQVGSSLPVVLHIDWPRDYIAFLDSLNFVNVDLLHIMGTSCVTRVDYGSICGQKSPSAWCTSLGAGQISMQALRGAGGDQKHGGRVPRRRHGLSSGAKSCG